MIQPVAAAQSHESFLGDILVELDRIEILTWSEIKQAKHKEGHAYKDQESVCEPPRDKGHHGKLTAELLALAALCKRPINLS